MANSLITPQYIAAKTLQVAHNKSRMIKMINSDYRDDFAKRGAKAGKTIDIRLPNSYTVRNGPVVNLQDTTERYVPLTIQPEFGVDIPFDDIDMILTIDDFTNRYIVPAGKRLATELDIRISSMFKQVAQQVGTPNAPPTTVQAMQDLWLQAGEKLDNSAAPMDEDRFALIGPRANRNVVSYLNLGFNDQNTIGQQYKTGQMNDALGFEFAKTQNAPTFITGAGGGTPLINGAAQGTPQGAATANPRSIAGTTSLATDGWTASTTVLKAGDSFTIAGVYALNPESKVILPYLMEFVATADVTSNGSGVATIVASPELISGGAYQNVSALPADNAQIVINHGATANTQYDQSLAFYKDAFTFVTVDMDLPRGLDMAEKSTYDGVSVRFLRGFDINNNRYVSRLDVLAGYACLRPDWAVRVFTN